jgi:uncharacterized protein (TIGR01244 family)
MPRYLTTGEMRTRAGRRRALRHLYLSDHGVLRSLYDNTHWIDARMARSFQPSPGHIAAWAKKGVKSVINLRGTRWEQEQPGYYWLEREACELAGIAHYDYRAFSREAPRREFITGFDALLGAIEYPAVMHCKSGADRAGLASVLYGFLHGGQALDVARRQLGPRFGHIKAGKTGILDAFFDVYREAAEAAGEAPSPGHFRRWIRDDYDRREVIGRFRANPLGSLLTEGILRRE